MGQAQDIHGTATWHPWGKRPTSTGQESGGALVAAKGSGDLSGRADVDGHRREGAHAQPEAALPGNLAERSRSPRGQLPAVAWPRRALSQPSPGRRPLRDRQLTRSSPARRHKMRKRSSWTKSSDRDMQSSGPSHRAQRRRQLQAAHATRADRGGPDLRRVVRRNADAGALQLARHQERGAD